MHAVRTFSNDPLKILRLLRHMSKSGVSASQEISHAIHTSAGLLRGIGGEPVRRELCALLCGAGVLQVLLELSLSWNPVLALSKIIGTTSIRFMNTLPTL